MKGVTHMGRAAASALAPVLAIGLAAAGPARAQPATTALVNARILPVAAPPIDRGTLVIRDGKILSVGAAGAVAIPAGAEQIDLAGKVVMPGLVDTHSHIGGGAGGDASSAMHPDARILDAFDARSSGLRRAVAGGITTVNVMPGSGHLLSGQTLYLKLRGGSTVDDLTIPRPDGQPLGGMKMANGTNSMRDPGGTFPATRARSAAIVRAQFVKAQEYQQQLQQAGDDPGRRPSRDLGLEGLVEVLDGTRIVHFHTHRHDDIVTAIRLGREFGFTPVLHHVSEAWKVADQIVAAGVPVSLTLVDSPGGKLEAMDMTMVNGAVLERAGARVAIHTDDLITDSRFFLRSAALAVRYGMSREKALAAVTIEAARMIGLDARVGSLEPGKDADFIVLSGDPLSVYSMVEQTWVEGRKVFDLARPADRLAAYGGPGASRGEHLHAHGDEEDR